MKANKIKVLTVAVVCSGVFISVRAQEPDNRLNREMTLEREYDPSLQDATKVNLLPEVNELVVTKRSIDYSPFTVPANPKKEFTVLPSGDIMTEILYNKRRGYFHFGGGMFMNLNGDVGYHILDTDKDLLNIFLTHRSTNGDVKYLQGEGEKQKAFLNDNLVGLGLRHRFTGSTLRLGAEYGYTGFNYYGLPLSAPSISSVWKPDSSDRTTKQVNQTVRGYLGIQSNENAGVGYLADVQWLHFSQKYGRQAEVEGLRENNLTGLFDFNVRLGEKNQRAGIAARLNYFNYTYPSRTDSLGYQNHLEATLTPYYRIDGETWHVKLGANLMLITGDSMKVFVSPDIAAEMQIAPRTVFYVNAGGAIGSNDAAGLSHRNRYMDYFGSTLPSRRWLDATAGIRSSLTPDLWVNVFAGYKITENEVFFIPAPRTVTGSFANSTAFQPDANHFQAGAALKYSCRQLVDVSLKGVYHAITFDEGDEAARTYGITPENMHPYGYPEMELNADLTVKPAQPLALTLGYYLGHKRCTLLYGEPAELSDINDLNLTATWNFNDTFGVYAKLNNLLFQEQEWWYGYPMQGFNAMVGININF
ncbi:MAG: TonB-dependent receptor [Tannerella sp.]|jgi:hypothetical protein|nr:TonB-dependent receptor [Tannerella sp.]